METKKLTYIEILTAPLVLIAVIFSILYFWTPSTDLDKAHSTSCTEAGGQITMLETNCAEGYACGFLVCAVPLVANEEI